MEPNHVSVVPFCERLMNLHGESPQVFAAAVVKLGFDDVCQRCEIGTSVSVNNTLWLGGSARGKGDGEHVIFMSSLSMKTRPASGPCGDVVVEALQNSLIEWSTKLALGGIGILSRGQIQGIINVGMSQSLPHR